MQALEPGKEGGMTLKEAASCINTIELLRRLAYNVHGLMDVIDDENCKKIISLLKEQDGNEPERKKGKWIHHTDWESDGECAYECPECGMGSDVNYNFCMGCGADMRGGQE